MATGTKVVGVGNYLLRDDGAGIHAVDQLRNRGVEAHDAGTVALFVLEALDGHDSAVILDAVKNGGEPGDVHVLDIDLEEDVVEAPTRGFTDAHGFDFLDAMDTASAAYDLPEQITLIGIEPKTIEPGVELSPEVAGSMEQVLKKVEELR